MDKKQCCCPMTHISVVTSPLAINCVHPKIPFHILSNKSNTYTEQFTRSGFFNSSSSTCVEIMIISPITEIFGIILLGYRFDGNSLAGLQTAGEGYVLLLQLFFRSLEFPFLTSLTSSENSNFIVIQSANLVNKRLRPKFLQKKKK